VKNGVSYRVKEEGFVLHTIKFRNVNRIYINLNKIVLLKHVIEGKTEGKIEVTGRRGRIIMHLLGELKEKMEFCKLKEEALDRTHWRTRCVGACGSVVRLENERTKERKDKQTND
jgi:hypothetical protein